MVYTGVVQKGDRRGTSLGFPTANIPYYGSESGVFAAKAMLGAAEYRAAVYADQRRKLLEVHLETYAGGDLYGKVLHVELLKKIRADRRFKNEQDLKTAITLDIRMVREYFASKN